MIQNQKQQLKKCVKCENADADAWKYECYFKNYFIPLYKSREQWIGEEFSAFMMIDCQASAWHQKSHIYFFFAQVDMCGKLVSVDKEKWVIIRQSGNVLPIFRTPHSVSW